MANEEQTEKFSMTKQNLTVHNNTKPMVEMRMPTKEDGADIWKLVSECPPLDQNSMYMNVVQCDHFARTCVLAERDGQTLGWVSGHIPPETPDTIFVWQVAVHDDARGLGLGKRMLRTLLDRAACAKVSKLETTITKSNKASWGLFKSFARDMGGDLSDAPHYTREDHLGGKHATEHLVTISLPRKKLRSVA